VLLNTYIKVIFSCFSDQFPSVELQGYFVLTLALGEVSLAHGNFRKDCLVSNCYCDFFWDEIYITLNLVNWWILHFYLRKRPMNIHMNVDRNAHKFIIIIMRSFHVAFVLVPLSHDRGGCIWGSDSDSRGRSARFVYFCAQRKYLKYIYCLLLFIIFITREGILNNVDYDILKVLQLK